MAKLKPYIQGCQETINNFNGSFGDCDFQYHNCCSQTQYGASPAILEGKPGPTEGAQRMPLLESRKLFASIVLLSWRLSAQPVDFDIFAVLLHPSKYKRRERAMLNIQHCPRVQPLLVVFMDAIDLLWFLVPVRLGIRFANPHIKECRALEIPEATRRNVQFLRLVLYWTLY